MPMLVVYVVDTIRSMLRIVLQRAPRNYSYSPDVDASARRESCAGGARRLSLAPLFTRFYFSYELCSIMRQSILANRSASVHDK